MCVLQDFEAITPNLLARTIETVEGGGLIILLLKTMTSLRQLYTMAMVRSSSRYLRFRVRRSQILFRTFMPDIEPRLMISLLLASTSDSSYHLALVLIVSSLTMN